MKSKYFDKSPYIHSTCEINMSCHLITGSLNMCGAATVFHAATIKRPTALDHTKKLHDFMQSISELKGSLIFAMTLCVGVLHGCITA